MMSNIGVKRTFAQAMRQLYSMGGMRAYYRGLTVSLPFIYMNVVSTFFFKSSRLASQGYSRMSCLLQNSC